MATYPPTKNFDESGFAPPVKPGEYHIRISDVREEDKHGKLYTDRNGNRYTLFEFDILGHQGNKVFDRFCFDENNEYYNINMGKFKQMLIAINVDVESGGDTKDLIGKSCMAYITTKDVNNKPMNNIGEYKVATENPPKSEDEDLPF